MFELIEIVGKIVIGAGTCAGASVATYMAVSPSTKDRPLAAACAVAFSLVTIIVSGN